MAYDYSGTAQYHSANSLVALRLAGDMSIFACLNSDTVAAGQAVIAGCGGTLETQVTNYLWALRRNGATVDLFWEHGAGVNDSVTLAGLTMSTGTWYRICAIRDVTAGNVRFVVNGTDYGTFTTGDFGYIAAPDGGSTSVVSIGGDSGGGSLVNGRIDSVALWNAKLSSEDAIALTKGISSPMVIRPGALVEFWPLLGSARGMKQALHLSATGSPTRFEGVILPRPPDESINYQGFVAPSGNYAAAYYYGMVGEAA